MPDPKSYWFDPDVIFGSGISDLRVTVQSGYPTINIGCYPLIPDPLTWPKSPIDHWRL